MSTSETIKNLILKLGSPIFMTSANQSGESTCTSLDEIEKMLAEQIYDANYDKELFEKRIVAKELCQKFNNFIQIII